MLGADFHTGLDARLDALRLQLPGWTGALPLRPGFTSNGKVAQVLGTLIAPTDPVFSVRAGRPDEPV